MFHTRTPLFFMLGSFLNSLVFMPVNFLLPQFFQGVRSAFSLSGRFLVPKLTFQVKGVDSFQSGIDLIPFSVCGALFAAVGKWPCI